MTSSHRSMPPHKHKTVLVERKKRRTTASKGYLEFRNVDRAVEAALYYGFSPLPTPLSPTKEDREKSRALAEHEGGDEVFGGAEKIALFRYFVDKKLADAPQPLLLCSELAAGASARKGHSFKSLFLDILGGSKSIAEAILIKTLWAILNEEGHSNLTLAVNSIGDRESANRFMRELTAYYRRHIATLPPPCRTMLKENPLALLCCPHEKCCILAQEAPKSIGFLSEGSRLHFKEMLEYLEQLEIPYAIDHTLTGSRAFGTETVWSIYAEEDGAKTLLAEGLRYTIGRRMGYKRDIPGVGAVVFLRREKGKNGVRIKRPNFLFLQLGFEAKIKGLKVIELLRRAGIPLYQSIARDKLMAQLSGSEHLKLPYTLIIGQKEAIENVTIVRNNATRAQEAVPIAQLPAYLKKLKVT